MAKRSPYPLQWPDGWPRTRYRETSAFDKGRGFIAARDGAIHQLELYRCAHIVITSNLPTQASGKPYTASAGLLPDPGIAIWWVKNGKEHVCACDRWRSALENMRAIEKTLEAIRAIDRWGSTKMVELAFAGFAALPPGGAEEVNVAAPKKTWRDVLGKTFGAWPEGVIDRAELLMLAKSRHRKLIQLHHPDAGGTHERAAELNAALAEAEKELSNG